MDRRDFTRALGISSAFQLIRSAPAEAQPLSQPLPKNTLSGAEVAALDFIPTDLHDAIRNGTIADDVDLGDYLRNAVATGQSLVFPAGRFPFSGTLAIGRGQCLRGAGRGGLGNRTLLQSLGASDGPAILLNGGESTISNLVLQGPRKKPPYVSDGIQIGEHDFSGIYVLRELRIQNFDRNIRLRGALWSSFYDVHSLLGTYGLNLDSLPGKFSTTCLFINCAFRENLRQGFMGLATSVRSVVFNFLGCDFENNATEAPGIPQVQPGAMAQATFDGCYFEDNSGEVDTLRLDSSGGLNIDTCYFNGGLTHIVASQGSSNYVTIGGGTRFIQTMAKFAIDMPGCANVIVSPTIETDKPFRLGGRGAGTTAITEAENISWTPQLLGEGGRGQPTALKAQGTFTKIDRRAFVECECEFKSAGNLKGQISIYGLPNKCAMNGCETMLYIDHSGIILKDHQTGLSASISPGNDFIQMFATGPGGRELLSISPAQGSFSLRLAGSYATQD